MPTVFTHAVLGAALVPFAPREVRGLRLGLALAAVSMAPDLDVAAFAGGIPYEHPLGHRGVSHSLFAALALGLAVPLAVARGAPATTRRALWMLGALAAASHGVLDAATDGGLGVGFFLPLWDVRLFLPIRPIPVSPIGPGFFGARGAEVLAHEMVWIWLPAGLLAAGAMRRSRRAQ